MPIKSDDRTPEPGRRVSQRSDVFVPWGQSEAQLDEMKAQTAAQDRAARKTFEPNTDVEIDPTGSGLWARAVVVRTMETELYGSVVIVLVGLKVLKITAAKVRRARKTVPHE